MGKPNEHLLKSPSQTYIFFEVVWKKSGTHFCVSKEATGIYIIILLLPNISEEIVILRFDLPFLCHDIPTSSPGFDCAQVANGQAKGWIFLWISMDFSHLMNFGEF